MKKITFLVAAFKNSLKYLFQDKFTLLLSLFPIAIGTILYIYFGIEFVSWGKAQLSGYIKEYQGTGGAVLKFLIQTVLTFIVLVIANYTFVLIVSIISSPFNDAISGRVSKLIKGQEPESIKDTIGNMLKKIVKTIFNELIKVGIILFLAAIAFVMSFFPVLAPVGITLSAILLATDFLDFNWGRNKWPVSRCIQDVVKNIFPYTLSGFALMGLIWIPFVNLLALPFGSVYYTVLWEEYNSSKDPRISKDNGSKTIEENLSTNT